MGPPAAAHVAAHPHQVVAPVADQRRRQVIEVRGDQLAHVVAGNGVVAVGRQVLGQDRVLPQVVAVVLAALPGGARVARARVDEQLEPPVLADHAGLVPPQRLAREARPLEAGERLTQVVRRRQPLELDDDRAHELHVGRTVRLDDLQDLRPVPHPGVGVDRDEAEHLVEAVEEAAEAAGRRQHAVTGPEPEFPEVTGRRQRQRWLSIPQLREELRLAGGPRARGDRRQLRRVHAQQAGVRIARPAPERPDVIAGDRGDPPREVVEVPDVRGADARRVPYLTVEGRTLVGVGHEAEDALGLELCQLGPGHRLDPGLEVPIARHVSIGMLTSRLRWTGSSPRTRREHRTGARSRPRASLAPAGRPRRRAVAGRARGSGAGPRRRSARRCRSGRRQC